MDFEFRPNGNSLEPMLSEGQKVRSRDEIGLNNPWCLGNKVEDPCILCLVLKRTANHTSAKLIRHPPDCYMTLF